MIFGKISEKKFRIKGIKVFLFHVRENLVSLFGNIDHAMTGLLSLFNFVDEIYSFLYNICTRCIILILI